MKNKLFVFFLLVASIPVSAQKNALGFNIGYNYFSSLPHNEMIELYNSDFRGNRSNQNTIQHMPGAELIYERKFTEYFYTQAHVAAAYAWSTSSDWKINFVWTGAMVNVNWYPVKMIKNLKKTAFNPMYIRFGGGCDYIMNNVEEIGDSTTIKTALTSISPFAETGIGYDLHFGKRLIVQPFFGLRFCMTPYNNDFQVTLTGRTDSDLPLKESALLYKANISFLFLF